MKNWTALFEQEQVFYHGSREWFRSGQVLEAQPDGYVRGTGLDAIERTAHHQCEAILEQHRPSGAPARIESVFLVTDPSDIDNAGGYTDYIYVVEPHHEPWKANLAWYSELYLICMDEIDDNEASELAVKYWSAVPMGKSDLYEYLVMNATVVAMAEDNS